MRHITNENGVRDQGKMREVKQERYSSESSHLLAIFSVSCYTICLAYSLQINCTNKHFYFSENIKINCVEFYHGKVIERARE